MRYASISARAEHKPLFHFVQPNQHDRGSKPSAKRRAHSSPFLARHHLLWVSPAGNHVRRAPYRGGRFDVSRPSVESQTLNTVLALPAQITPYQIVDIYPKVTGFIEMIRVDRGSHVRAGEVIIRLSAPELAAQRAQGEANIQTAESQLSAAQAKLSSDEGTYQHLAAAAKTPGVVAGNDVLVAEQAAAADRAQAQAATNNVQAAEDALRSVKQLESYLEIRAPFNGVVTVRNLHSGALVGPTSGTSRRTADCPDRRPRPSAPCGSGSRSLRGWYPRGPAGGL